MTQDPLSRVASWIAPASPDAAESLLLDEAAFLAAEREFAEQRCRRDDFVSRHHTDAPEELWDRSEAIEVLISASPPPSRAAAAVKLRLLLDPRVGIATGGFAHKIGKLKPFLCNRRFCTKMG